MSHVAMSLLDFLVPAGVTIAFQNSFLISYALKFCKWGWARGLITCPLCFGFHVSWVWCLWNSWNLVYVFPMCVTCLVLGVCLSAVKAHDEAMTLMADKARADAEHKDRDNNTDTDDHGSDDEESAR